MNLEFLGLERPSQLRSTPNPVSSPNYTETFTDSDQNRSTLELVIDAARNLSKSINSASEDERRLAALGYNQEVKRIFSTFTNFGLTASMISILLGVIPLYTYELNSGGSAVMIWSWVIIGVMTVGLVQALGEICCAFPTMGALYYWSFVLGGPEWGPFCSWVSGWCNLLGQIAGVASGGYAGATIFAQIITLSTGQQVPTSNAPANFSSQR